MSEQALWDRIFEMDEWWRESTWYVLNIVFSNYHSSYSMTLLEYVNRLLGHGSSHASYQIYKHFLTDTCYFGPLIGDNIVEYVLIERITVVLIYWHTDWF